MAKVECECGTIYGESCGCSVATSETVQVEWMPEQHRSSHEAAGNSGVYPHNGAVRLTLARSHVKAVLKDEGKWAHEVKS